jgi:hypothetical protein
MRRETEISDRVVAGLCKDTPYLFYPLAPSPSKMERGRGAGEWLLGLLAAR